MELARLPYRKDKTFEDYACERGLERLRLDKWRKHIFKIVGHLSGALEPDSIVMGGGNAKKLGHKPPKCMVGLNKNAFAGGIANWENKNLII